MAGNVPHCLSQQLLFCLLRGEEGRGEVGEGSWSAPGLASTLWSWAHRPAWWQLSPAASSPPPLLLPLSVEQDAPATRDVREGERRREGGREGGREEERGREGGGRERGREREGGRREGERKRERGREREKEGKKERMGGREGKT